MSKSPKNKASELATKTEVSRDDSGSGGGSIKTAVGTGDDFGEHFWQWLAKISSLTASEKQAMLGKITSNPEGIKYVLTNFEGMVVAHNLSTAIQAESVAIWSLGSYMGSEMVLKKMNLVQQPLRAIVNLTTLGYSLSIQFDTQLLTLLIDDNSPGSLNNLLRSLLQIAA